ncbi:MAG TPA: transposase [Planctomycetaceae bacterium]|nr:transposase [Planctomycetaceae bacterium]
MSARKRTKKAKTRKRSKAAKSSRRRKNNSTNSKAIPAESNARALEKLREWLLPKDQIFAGLKLHGNTDWSPANLVWLALCWAWEESRNLTDAFDEAKDQCRQLGIAALDTYQGMMKALVRWTDPLMVVVWSVLHQRMRKIRGKHWRTDGWVPIAFDGSRSSAPRTVSNEDALCAPNYGHGPTAKYRKKKTKGMRRRKNEKNKPQPQEPQAWITMLWHMGLRLPWMWRLGPSNSSERAHVQEMLEVGDFPENTLFCGDAGFVGYPLWSQIIERGDHFLVRVGGNVYLLYELANVCFESSNRVLCWPQEAQSKHLPPLTLRLVKVKIGQTKMWMLTSVLDSRRLSKLLIARFYRMRWGIELEFRGLKQTLDRAKLRCRNSERLLAELNWSILAMAVAELFALKEQLASRNGGEKSVARADPGKRSLANVIRALRRCLRRLNRTPAPGEDLTSQLRMAVTDSYQRKSSKKARYRPPNPDKKPLGDPNLRRLNDKERRALKALATQKTTA